MPHTVSRYEFRVVDPDLASLRDRLVSLSTPGEPRESLELYLQIPRRLDLNLKIRDDRLELKRLIRTRNDLQQWLPAFREDFPLSVAAMRERLSTRHGVSLALPAGNDSLEAHDVVQAIAGKHPEIALMSVHKRRSKHEIEGCSAEFVQLLVNGAHLSSAALESEDPDAVEALREQLDLTGRENVSYVLALERVRGAAPLPQEACYNAVARWNNRE